MNQMTFAFASARPSSLADAMGNVLRDAAERVIMPRFQRLADGDIEEKSPGDLVTVADREAECLIAQGLQALDPQARFVGEEVCARDSALLNGLDAGDAWIVDPIDGTGNYAAGRAPFAVMAAYMRRGELVASCILDPMTGSIITAERGCGAWRDGERIAPGLAGKPVSALRGIVSGFQRPAAMETRVEVIAERIDEVVPTQRCAGAEYPLIAAGALDFAMYWRTLVWDHAPGVLIVQEAGGKAARLDGAPYRPADPSGSILLAHTPDVWDQAAAMLSR